MNISYQMYLVVILNISIFLELNNFYYSYLIKSDLKVLEDFDKLNIFSKVRVLEEIFRVITRLDNFSLKDVGGYKAITRARISINKILKSKDFCIINQSPTGLFEKKVFLDK